MTLTQKEQTLLKDLRDQERVCIEKYGKFAAEAKAEELKELLSSIASAEREHEKTVSEMLSGTVPQVPTGLQNENDDLCAAVGYQSEDDRTSDKFLCSDLLSTEKHTATLYNTCVFEFTDPNARKMLSHIQAEEQQHGQKLYTFMNNNGMYN